MSNTIVTKKNVYKNLLDDTKLYNVYLIEFESNRAVKKIMHNVSYIVAGKTQEDEQLLYNPILFYVAGFERNSPEDLKYAKHVLGVGKAR